MPSLVDLTGKRFGRLFVTMRANPHGGKPGKHIYWACLCDCGTVKNIQGDNLKSGDIKSCGCLLRELEQRGGGAFKHGHAGRGQSPEYRSWYAMKQRCGNPKNKRWLNYGGRGIRVCRRWNSFSDFLKDMGQKPTLKHSIERENNDGNYTPSNCRWATNREQSANRRSRRKYQATSAI